MESGLDSPGKKRKQSANGLRRDQPLLASRQESRLVQQPPEFLTDSLYPSSAPSPSLPNSSTRPVERARARQAFADARKLAAALKTETQINDENRPLSSRSSSDRSRLQESLKRRAHHAPYLLNPASRSKAASSPTRRKTPSPSRGRQHESLTSPAVSEPSPARGYAEAYQRIVDEEVLAQEDSVEGLEEDGEYDFRQRGGLQSDIRSELHDKKPFASPVSLRASLKVLPRGILEKTALKPQEPNIYEEDMAHDSSSDSGVEGTEDVTNTSLDSGMSQHARDLARLSALTEGVKALNKARVGARVGVTVDNLRRRHASNESLHSNFSARSLSIDSDPWPRTPDSYDQKAKPRKDWLNRINSRTGRLTGDVFKRHSAGSQILIESQDPVPEAPIDQWIASSAEVHLPAGKEGITKTRELPRDSIMSPAVQQSGSLERKSQWDIHDDDFTGRSLQVSQSPPLRIGSAPLDRMRERELEYLADHAETGHELFQANCEEQREATPQALHNPGALEKPHIIGDFVDQAIEQTPKDLRQQIDLKTPLVTGAWIDTPLPTGGRGLPMPTPSDLDHANEEPSTSKLAASDLIHRLNPTSLSTRPKLLGQAPLKYSGSRLPKSVLEEILKDAKTPVTSGNSSTPFITTASEEDDPALQLGETTIRSLEEFVASDRDVSTLPASTFPVELGRPSSPSSDPLPPSPALIRYLLSRLTNLTTSLCASGKQIASLERAASAIPSSNKPQDISNEESNIDGSANHQCPNCGCLSQQPDLDFRFLYSKKSGIIAFTFPFPRLWYWRRHDWRPRLTWLGFLVVLAWVLVNAESYARYRFCHKLYATHMIGYGVDINAPRPPFVLVKVLWRYAFIETSIFAVVRFLVRLSWGLVGYIVGFVGGVWNEDTGGAGEQIVHRGPDMGMLADEYL